jgi:CubicO group peptidase (beta-lactamase class C family)
MGTGHRENWDRLREFVEERMQQWGIPGSAVGILDEDQVVAAGFGVTNIDHPLPVTDETLFQIGSITKTFTTMAIMRLVEMGKLELDATVRTYLPDFKVADETASSQATVRHLLTHAGGWVGDFFHDTGPGDDALARYVTDMADLEQLAPVGALWSYNNAAFCVAGRVMEMVTASSYEAALRELVLDPLGLESCYFDPADVMTRGFAVGHEVTGEGAGIARPWALPRGAYAAGGIACHIQDLLRYARFHLANGRTVDGTQLLSGESMSVMHSPQLTIWGPKERLGLAWRIEEVEGTSLHSHGGGTKGQISLLLLVPRDSFAIAVVTNSSHGGKLTGDVSRWGLKQYLDIERPDPTPIESSEEDLAPYAGRYVRPLSEIELGMLAGKLIGQMTPKGGFPTEESPVPPPPPPMSLALCEVDRLLVLDGPYKDAKMDIVRLPDGKIGWLRASGRIHVREE